MNSGQYKTNVTNNNVTNTNENSKLCYGCRDPLPARNVGGKPYNFLYCPKCRQYKLDEILADPEIQANRKEMLASIQHRR